MGDQAADVEIHRFGHRRIDFHPRRREPLLLGAQTVPRAMVVGQIGEQAMARVNKTVGEILCRAAIEEVGCVAQGPTQAVVIRGRLGDGELERRPL